MSWESIDTICDKPKKTVSNFLACIKKGWLLVSPLREVLFHIVNWKEYRTIMIAIFIHHTVQYSRFLINLPPTLPSSIFGCQKISKHEHFLHLWIVYCLSSSKTEHKQKLRKKKKLFYATLQTKAILRLKFHASIYSDSSLTNLSAQLVPSFAINLKYVVFVLK